MSKDLRAITEDYWKYHNCAISSACGILKFYQHEGVKLVKDALLTFGGGMGEGSICGAVSGSMVALNILLKERGIEPEQIRKRTDQFKDWFDSEFNSLECGEMMKHFKNEQGEYRKELEVQRKEHCTSCVVKAAEKIHKLIES